MWGDRDDQEVVIPCGGVDLAGTLGAGETSHQVVLIADDGGSDHSESSRVLAQTLQSRDMATMLIDLLTPEEKRADVDGGSHRFDINLLSRRLVAVVDWLAADKGYAHGSIGCVAADVAAAAALIGAARRPALVGAVVCRGGRADLAGAEILGTVRAPALLIVGDSDHELLRSNRLALSRLQSESALEIIPGASHLLEEPGAVDRVTSLASQWFHQHLWSISRSADQPANV
jgi:putative phosphoribosyl transferase